MAETLPVKAGTIDEKTIKDFLFSSKTKLDDQQQTMFIRLAKEFNLNPFKREIYAIAYGNEFNIVTGYQMYLARADATGKLDGWEVVCNGDEAKITIFRKDFSHPFTWSVRRSDFSKEGKTQRPNSWDKMPDFMLKKVAIGQGFRLAFPNELSGMPYLPEELGEAEENGKNGNQPAAKPAQKAKPEEQAAAMTPEQDWQKDDWKRELDQAINNKVINNQDVKNTVKLNGGTSWASLTYEQAKKVREAYSDKLGPIKKDITEGTDFNATPVNPAEGGTQ